jgi:hypothetical protein
MGLGWATGSGARRRHSGKASSAADASAGAGPCWPCRPCWLMGDVATTWLLALERELECSLVAWAVWQVCVEGDTWSPWIFCQLLSHKLLHLFRRPPSPIQTVSQESTIIMERSVSCAFLRVEARGARETATATATASGHLVHQHDRRMATSTTSSSSCLLRDLNGRDSPFTKALTSISMRCPPAAKTATPAPADPPPPRATACLAWEHDRCVCVRPW